MKHIFYENWTKKRLNKIINIFGENWFQNKRILELGACYGDIGIEFLKLGADVTFSDARKEFLFDVEQKLLSLNYYPTIIAIDQENDYNIGKTFDLVLHLGLLYNLENWKNDLKSALSHTNIMILETMVRPGTESLTIEPPKGFHYGPFNERVMSVIPQEIIEEELTKLGCKFIRFDDSSLNCKGWFYKDCIINHIYDWTYEKYKLGLYNNTPDNMYHCRRFWLVLK